MLPRHPTQCTNTWTNSTGTRVACEFDGVLTSVRRDFEPDACYRGHEGILTAWAETIGLCVFWSESPRNATVLVGMMYIDYPGPTTSRLGPQRRPSERARCSSHPQTPRLCGALSQPRALAMQTGTRPASPPWPNENGRGDHSRPVAAISIQAPW